MKILFFCIFTVYIEQPLEFSNVLHVRIPISCIHYTCYHLLGDNNSSLLFPSVLRRLSLVNITSKMLNKNYTHYFHALIHHSRWWRSFLTSGFTAVYLFIYCCHYFVTKLQINDSASTFVRMNTHVYLKKEKQDY